MDEFTAGFMAGQADGNNNGNNGGWGDGWMGLLAFAMIFGGWGGGGWGGFGGFGGGYGGGAYPVESILQRSLDTQTIIGKLDGLSNGVCSLGYDQLNQMNGLGRQIDQNAFAAERAANSNAMFMMQQFNQAAAERASCCCKTENLIQDVRFDMERSDCSIKTLMQQLFQQLQWGQQNGIRDLMSLIENKFCNLSMQQKDETIAQLRAQLAQCSDQNIANSIVSRLTAVINPPAVPAYPATNPNGIGNWAPQVLNGGGYSYGNGCGCNSGCNSGCGF